MKKVVITSKLNQISTDELPDDEIYAFYVKELDTTVLIILNDNQCKTTALYADGLNEWCYEANSLKEIIEEILCDGHEVLNFDDEHDFGRWLAESRDI